MHLKRNINIGVLFGDLFQGNMGCNALTYSTIDILEIVAKKLDITFNYILSENSIIDKSILPPDIECKEIQTVRSLSVPFKGRLKDIILHALGKNVVRRDIIRDLDFVVCATRGDSFSDIYGSFHIISKVMQFPLKNDIPLIMLPQTIGPFKSSTARKKAAVIVKRARAIFTRDPLSTELLKKMKGSNSVYESVDMALFMRYEKKPRTSRKIRVGINPSGLLWNGGYTQNNQFALKDDYADLLQKISSVFMKENNVQIEYIPHVLAGPYYHYIEDDYRVCKLLHHAYPDSVLAPYFYTPIEAKSYISGLDFLLGSRMHCCIAAYSSGVPVFPLAYSRKFSGLFERGLNYKYLADLTTDENEVILKKVKRAYDQREEISREMPVRLEAISQKKNELINELTDVIQRILKKE